MTAGNLKHKEVITMTNDINNLSHTTWNCKYHIVFAPKYRRQVFYKDNKVEIKGIKTIMRMEESEDNGSRGMS